MKQMQVGRRKAERSRVSSLRRVWGSKKYLILPHRAKGSVEGGRQKEETKIGYK